jgi:uncharacterized protein YjiS (DUF1127 family)
MMVLSEPDDRFREKRSHRPPLLPRAFSAWCGFVDPCQAEVIMSIFWRTNPLALLASFLLDVTLSARSKRRQVAALRHLDDHLLKDIGLSRRDVQILEAGSALRDSPFPPSRGMMLSRPQLR